MNLLFACFLNFLGVLSQKLQIFVDPTQKNSIFQGTEDQPFQSIEDAWVFAKNNGNIQILTIFLRNCSNGVDFIASNELNASLFDTVIIVGVLQKYSFL